MSVTKRAIIIFSFIITLMLISPLIIVNTVRSLDGMWVMILMFLAVNPIVSIYIGFLSGQDIRHFWWTPIVIAVLFWVFSSLIFEITFPVIYSVVYFVIAGITMLLTWLIINRKTKYATLLIIILCVVIGFFCFKACSVSNEDEIVEPDETEKETMTFGITEIPVGSVKGITPEQAEELCYSVMGEKDEETGNTYSFGISGAVEWKGKQYYIIRASWLVNNDHLSYIGDFFVSAGGDEIYDGIALPGDYEIGDLILSKQ